MQRTTSYPRLPPRRRPVRRLLRSPVAWGMLASLLVGLPLAFVPFAVSPLSVTPRVLGPQPMRPAPPAVEATFTVHMSAAGSDTNDGLASTSPVRSLARVEQVLREYRPITDVEVRIQQGTYVAPQVTWDFYVPGHAIRFLPVDYEPGERGPVTAGRPVFRSDGSPGWWFLARLPAGHSGGDTNLEFYYLQVEQYATGGLNINGGITTNRLGVRVPASEGANRNTVRGMIFRELGSKHSGAGFGYAGVDLVNSSNNLIRDNQFRFVENLGAEIGLIHGVYVAHWSRGNTVSHNGFYYVSGSPIQVRNDSNDNNIFRNRIERSGSTAYYEWFCDAPCVDDIDGHPRECASHGNAFYDNNLVSGYAGKANTPWALHPPGNDYPGGAGCDNEGERRIQTHGNR